VPGPPPLRIFISYRRDDASGHAGRLYDALAGRYGDRNVFMDVDAIPLGSDFAGEIDRAVASCDVVIVLIGRAWLQATDASGRRRLEDENDYLRREIESALAHDVVVVPTCVQGTPMPRADQLPEALAPLTRRQGIELDDAGWQDDVARLIRRLEGSGSERRPRRRLVALALALLVLAGGAAALALTGDDPEGQAAQQPEGAEARLLARVPASARAGCHPASERHPTAQASLSCDVAETLTTTYHLFADEAAADAWYRQARAAEDIRPEGGGCTADDFPGEATYGDGGSYFCLGEPPSTPELFALDRRTRVGLEAGVWGGTGRPAYEKLLDLWPCCIRVAGGT
jgi:hypothetical protein